MSVNVSDISKELAHRTNLDVDFMAGMVSTFFALIADKLRDGNSVGIRGFGTFLWVTVAEHKIRHPRTGKELVVPMHRRLKFIPSKGIKYNG